MNAERWTTNEVFLYRHPVDMRKGVGGLCALVVFELGREPNDRSLYVFINRARDKIKLLVWHLNGYWVLYKRLEKQRFSWPDWFEHECLSVSQMELDYLLDGYNLNGMRPHRTLSFARSF